MGCTSIIQAHVPEAADSTHVGESLVLRLQGGDYRVNEKSLDYTYLHVGSRLFVTVTEHLQPPKLLF